MPSARIYVWLLNDPKVLHTDSSKVVVIYPMKFNLYIAIKSNKIHLYSKKVKVKLKFSLCSTKHHAMKAYWEWRYSSTYSLTSALDGGEWSTSRPGRFTPRERAPGTHWIGGWVGPRTVLDAVVKRKIPSPRRESNPRSLIVQLAAQRYTD
jgi:hypothetical protein